MHKHSLNNNASELEQNPSAGKRQCLEQGTHVGGYNDVLIPGSPSYRRRKSKAQPRPQVQIPLRGIGPVLVPNCNDVLSGRGGKINSHAGNVQFREAVSAMKKDYLSKSTRKLDKAHMAAKLVQQVRSMDPPGRFLKEEEKDGGLWFDIGDAKAIKKVCQALREDSADLRQELGLTQVDNNKSNESWSSTDGKQEKSTAANNEKQQQQQEKNKEDEDDDASNDLCEQNLPSSPPLTPTVSMRISSRQSPNRHENSPRHQQISSSASSPAMVEEVITPETIRLCFDAEVPTTKYYMNSKALLQLPTFSAATPKHVFSNHYHQQQQQPHHSHYLHRQQRIQAIPSRVEYGSYQAQHDAFPSPGSLKSMRHHHYHQRAGGVPTFEPFLHPDTSSRSIVVSHHHHPPMMKGGKHYTHDQQYCYPRGCTPPPPPLMEAPWVDNSICISRSNSSCSSSSYPSQWWGLGGASFPPPPQGR